MVDSFILYCFLAIFIEAFLDFGHLFKVDHIFGHIRNPLAK